MNLNTSLTGDDIKRIYEEAKQAMSLTDRACSSTSPNEIDAHQTRLEQSQSGLETLHVFLQTEIDRMKSSLGAVKVMQKDLQRHMDRSKRSYWLVRNQQPKF